MLDNCRQGSLIQQILGKKMHTSERKALLNLKILNGERSEPTMAIDRLQVLGVKNDNIDQSRDGVIVQ